MSTVHGSGPQITLEDVIYTPEGSLLTVRWGAAAAEIELDVVGDEAVELALASAQSMLDAGSSLTDAVRAARSSREVAHRCALRLTREGVVVLDDTAATNVRHVRSGLRVLAAMARDRARSFAVLGELDSEPRDHLDDHDSLGRLAVRLNISQLIVVGYEARHIHVAAGLEGSWDGESVLVASTVEAYDVLREHTEPGDIVLVTGSRQTPLVALVELMAAGGPS